GVIKAESTISPETEEGRTGTLTLSSPQKDLIGSATTQQPVTTKTTQVLTFLVPKDGKIKLIGGLETLAGAQAGRSEHDPARGQDGHSGTPVEGDAFWQTDP